jgi:decaprenylphospho-beta-D-erythro-pentofuranosid-2-ulose 2-reductase
MTTRNILILGATSSIAEHTARIWAARGARLYLVGRNAARLRAIADDLGARGAASTATEVADLRNLDGHKALVDRAASAMGHVDVVLIAHGLLGKPELGQIASVEEIMDTNATSAISLLECVAAVFEDQGHGVAAVIGSVAGDRGRATNALYGAAKAALAAHASATRQRLARSGAWVVTVKPGFVDTPMTEGFKKGPLWANPATIGQGIVTAVDRRQATVYLPHFWRWIMLLIRLLPEKIFLKTRF